MLQESNLRWRPTFSHSMSTAAPSSPEDHGDPSEVRAAVKAHYRAIKGSCGRLPRAVSMFDIIIESLVQYKRIYGSVDVSLDFTIPLSLPWDQKAWGLDLGRLCNTLRKSEFIKSCKKTRFANSPIMTVLVTL